MIRSTTASAALVLALALTLDLGVVAFTNPAQAQDAPKKRITQMFISPMGEPFRAGPGDPYPVDLWFKGADANGDGIVTREEFRADALRFFKQLDTDSDGMLDGDEIKIYENKVAPEITADIMMSDNQREHGATPDYIFERGPGGEAPQITIAGGGSRIDKDHAAKHSAEANLMNSRRGAGKFGFLDDTDPVHGCDTNIDFRVSLREWMEAADRRFIRIDTAHKGQIAFADLPSTPFQVILAAHKKDKD
jgi:hypothetical protein